jgi:hypothetical protein
VLYSSFQLFLSTIPHSMKKIKCVSYVFEISYR